MGDKPDNMGELCDHCQFVQQNMNQIHRTVEHIVAADFLYIEQIACITIAGLILIEEVSSLLANAFSMNVCHII